MPHSLRGVQRVRISSFTTRRKTSGQLRAATIYAKPQFVFSGKPWQEGEDRRLLIQERDEDFVRDGETARLKAHPRAIKLNEALPRQIANAIT